MNAVKRYELSKLILECLEGRIPPGRFQVLDRLLAGDPEAAEHYAAFMQIYIHLKKPGAVYAENAYSNLSQLDRELWQSLAEAEKISPAIQMPSKTDKSRTQAVAPKIIPARDKSPVSRSRIFLLILSSAAMLLLFAMPYWIPRRQYVATLTETVQVRWATDSQAGAWERFHDRQKPVRLESGLAKVLFDSGVEVILEGPSEFQITSPENILLNAGSVFVSVPKNAIGFTVNTPYSKVIDLGTEFGVRVAENGASEVHVLKGKASLVSGSQGNTRGSQTLQAGQACQVDPSSGQIREIRIAQDLFARKICNQSGMVWRGESVSLADILQGGNGRGTGQGFRRINPLDGKFLTDVSKDTWKDSFGNSRYHPVLESPFIDGVFVPDRQDGGVVISAEGHCFQECPDTCNRFHAGIYAQKREDLLNGQENDSQTMNPADLRSISEFIMMHTNQGITFDLDAIRKEFPGVRMDSFSTFFQFLRPDEKIPEIGKADYWILVDGRIRNMRENVTASERIMISVDLKPQDRFLTLVTTDAGLQDGAPSAIVSDFCIFANPVLLLK